MKERILTILYPESNEELESKYPGPSNSKTMKDFPRVLNISSTESMN